MSEHVYKIVELVGTSPESVERAISNAVAHAGATARWFEVLTTRGHIEGGKVAHYQVEVKIGLADEA